MAIEINGLPSPQLRGTSQSSKTSSTQLADGKSSRSTATTGSDTVVLTDMATMLKEIEQSLAAIPVVDMARVNSVKQSLENGTFELDPVQVAERVIEFEFAYGKKS